MLNVKNKKTIHQLALKSLKANRLRNTVAVAAIALTTILFTTIFTIGISLNEAFQQANFRMVGGYAHAGLKYLSEEQYDELKVDPLIKEYGLRRFVGMPSKVPFNKSHVEVGYSDENQRNWMFLNPIAGTFPQEGTNEAATDTRVLELLGIEPKVGTEFTLTFDVDGTETTETFTLCGFWEYDEAIVASHVLIPLSRVEAIFTKLGTKGIDGMTGTWNMDLMFKSSLNIESNLQKVLQRHGYQDKDPSQPMCISTGINWGYSSAQLSDSIDAITIIGILVTLLLIIFTGYLIIYNVFQISVAGDIRFYGLLKTIGTTPAQLKRIIHKQAVILSCVGIPIGLLLGYGVGIVLTPIILARINGVVASTQSVSPVIFLGSALFSLITVFLSCSRPGTMAANVSAIEAVRYAEGATVKKSTRKNNNGISIPKMAVANLGRNRGKTVITIASLSLAILLLNFTFTFTNGFDMNKYLRNVVVDFTVSDAGYFQVTKGWGSESVDDETITLINQQADIVNGGRTYGKVTPMLQFMPPEFYRTRYSSYNPSEIVDQLLQKAEKLPDGKVADGVQLYGMDEFLLNKVTVLEGDVNTLTDTSGNYIAAVYLDDDYGNPKYSSHWAKLGDIVTIRYIDEREFINPYTGEVYEGDIPDGADYEERVTKFHDVEYEVAALVMVPHTLSYRYYAYSEFILSSDAFIKDTGSNSVMYYAFDTSTDTNATMEEFLASYTQNEGRQYDYESKETYVKEFESFRNMFLLLGSVLSFIIGLVGVLNFLNAVLTSIISRRKEFAMLQSIGMTGKQLKSMLIWESLYYTIGSIIICLLLCLVTAPLMSSALSSVFWFFTYQFTFVPILLCIPFMLAIAFIVPYLGYKNLVQQSIVERLREAE